MTTTLDFLKPIEYTNRSNDYNLSIENNRIEPFLDRSIVWEKRNSSGYLDDPVIVSSMIDRPYKTLLVSRKYKSINDQLIQSLNRSSINLVDYPPKIREINKLVLGKRTYFLPPELKNIVEEIRDSKEILELQDNWDYQEASAVSEELYNAGISFLLEYSMFILIKTGIVIVAPEINAGRNGNIFISWRTKKARLAISIEYADNGQIIANYYGDLKNNGQPIKGNVSVGEVSDYLAYWMKNLI